MEWLEGFQYGLIVGTVLTVAFMTWRLLVWRRGVEIITKEEARKYGLQIEYPPVGKR